MEIPFGVLKGKDTETAPSSYLRWLVNNVSDNEELVVAAEEELAYRDRWNSHFEDD